MSGKRTERLTDAEITDAKKAAANALRTAIDEASYHALEDVGLDIGVGETRVRRLVCDKREDLDVVPNTAQMILAPETLFDAWLARIVAEREKVHGPRAAKTLETLMLQALGADAAVAQSTVAALADGVVSPVEAAAIEQALDHSDTVRGKARGLLAARRKR